MYPDPDQILIERIKEGDVKAFEALFRTYYTFLCHYAARIVKEAADAEEIVQELFLKIWERRISLKIDSSIKNYLFRSVKNQCLNHLRHLKIQDAYIEAALLENDSELDEYIEDQVETIRKIEDIVVSMPKKRQEIFRLSRQQGLKYKEIADTLSISVKTVETQIGIALKTIRAGLKNPSDT